MKAALVQAHQSERLPSFPGSISHGQGLKSLFPEYNVPEEGSPERKAIEAGGVCAVISIGFGKILAGVFVRLGGDRVWFLPSQRKPLVALALLKYLEEYEVSDLVVENVVEFLSRSEAVEDDDGQPGFVLVVEEATGAQRRGPVLERGHCRCQCTLGIVAYGLDSGVVGLGKAANCADHLLFAHEALVVEVCDEKSHVRPLLPLYFFLAQSQVSLPLGDLEGLAGFG